MSRTCNRGICQLLHPMDYDDPLDLQLRLEPTRSPGDSDINRTVVSLIVWSTALKKAENPSRTPRKRPFSAATSAHPTASTATFSQRFGDAIFTAFCCANSVPRIAAEDPWKSVFAPKSLHFSTILLKSAQNRTSYVINGHFRA